MEIVLAMDDRTCAACAEELAQSGAVVAFRSGGIPERGYRALGQVRSDFALRVDDDEIPSRPLWDFAMRPPSPSRFGVLVVPILGDRMMSGHTGLMERLFWTEGWRYVPRTRADGQRTLFEGHVESPAPLVPLLLKDGATPGLFIAHYLLEAPREERERKAARYDSFDPHRSHRDRLIYEDQPEAFVPIPEAMRRYMSG